LQALRRQDQQTRADALEDQALAHWGGKATSQRIKELRKADAKS
jgi:hypothetical protein